MRFRRILTATCVVSPCDVCGGGSRAAWWGQVRWDPVGVRSPVERGRSGVRLSAPLCQTNPTRLKSPGPGWTSPARPRSAARPAAAQAAAVPSACGRLVSISSVPPGRSQAAAPAATRRCRARPSAPPSRAIRCSWSRASVGISAISSVGTYGAFTASTSTRPSRSPGRASYRSPSCTSPHRHVAPRAGDRRGIEVGGVQLRARARARRSPPRSRRCRSRGRRRPAARASTMIATARSTSASVRRRGTNTPGATRDPQPAELGPADDLLQRLARHAALDHVSAGRRRVRASASSSAASSSANTQPAARSSSTMRGSGSANNPPAQHDAAPARRAPRGPAAGRGRRRRSPPWCPRTGGRRARATPAPARTPHPGRPRR